MIIFMWKSDKLIRIIKGDCCILIINYKKYNVSSIES